MSDLKRIKRDPLKFGVFDAYALDTANSIHNLEQLDNFKGTAYESLTKSLADEAFLHGQRTQNMFEAVIVSLGKIRLIKSEDAGGGWFDADSLAVPDFRIIMADGEQFLVEVKNYHRDPISRPFSMTAKYYESLTRYGEWVNSPILLAIYWSRMNLWTTIPLEALKLNQEKREISLGDALAADTMGALGDIMIGTKAPLAMHLIADRDEPREVVGNQALMTFGEVKLFCAGEELVDDVERRIAHVLMLFGRWEHESEPMLILDDEGLPSHCVYECDSDDDDNAGFCIVGNLSGIYSRYYALSTLEDGRVARVKLPVTPGLYGNLIPADYHSERLPLWRFVITPRTTL